MAGPARAAVAVGVPIVAGVLAGTPDSLRFFTRRVTLTVGLGVVVGHTLAYWQMLEKYAVGADGRLRFWLTSGWSPPISLLFALIGFPIAIALLTWWCLTTANSDVNAAGSDLATAV